MENINIQSLHKLIQIAAAVSDFQIGKQLFPYLDLSILAWRKYLVETKYHG